MSLRRGASAIISDIPQRIKVGDIGRLWDVQNATALSVKAYEHRVAEVRPILAALGFLLFSSCPFRTCAQSYRSCNGLMINHD